MTAPTTADVLVVLGGGVLPDGTLPPLAAARVNTAVALLRRGAAPRIVFSGCCSLAQATPVHSEAAAMAAHAAVLGVDGELLFVEDRSRDTLGNAYFTRRRYLAPNAWRRVHVVTTDFHLARAAWTFAYTLGPGYDVRCSPSPSTLPPAAVAALLEEETAVLRFVRGWCARLSAAHPEMDGPAVIEHLIRHEHGAYAPHPAYPIAAMQRDLEAEKRRMRATASIS